MKDIGDAPMLERGIYRHYKGGIYEVVDVACHTETLEWYVVYRSQERVRMGLPSVWVRPYAMFIEVIELDGKMTPRFMKVVE